MATELTAAQHKAITVREYINKPHIVKQLEAALPSFLNPDRFLRTCYTAMLRNAALLDCTKESMLSAMIESAQLGLEPVLGKAALIPYGKEMQFQPMYRGLIDLGRRTADIKVTAHVVYEKDEFDIEYGDNEKCYHKPYLQGDRGEKLGAYTVWSFINSGTQSFLFMPTVDILQVRDTYSKAWKKSGKDSVWGKSEAEMFKKTVIKNHSKLQPCSIEMERAVELDNRAEIGASQADMLGTFDGFGPEQAAKTEPKGKIHDQHLIDKFDTMVKEQDDVDSGNLDEYLKLSAETQQGTTIQDVKAFVVTKSGFTSFWEFYQSWEGYKSTKKATPMEGPKDKKDNKHSAFVQQFINLRKGDSDKNTGLLSAILKYQVAIKAAPTEDQEAIRKKFQGVYGPDAEYPLDQKTGTQTEEDEAEKPELSGEAKEAKILKFVEGAEKDDALGVLVPCPNREGGDLLRSDKCDVPVCMYKERVGCPTWTEFDKEG